MKSIINALKALFIVIIFFSCSSEVETVIDTSIDIDVPVEKVKLKSITKLNYSGDFLQWSQKMNFVNDELVKIEYKDGSYDLTSYTNGLLLEIEEFSATDLLEWTTTYTYDNSKRLKMKKVTPGPDNPDTDVSRQKDFVYEENQIQSISSWSDGGLHKNTMVTNTNKFITEDNLYSPNDNLVGSFLFSYSGKNLSKLIHKDNNGTISFETTYNYLSETPSKYYDYIKFLFGIEWRNNSSLNKQFGLGQYDSFEISKNYITNYNHDDFENSDSRTGTFDYEFDSEGNILKQTENIKHSNGNEFKIVTIYEYE